MKKLGTILLVSSVVLLLIALVAKICGAGVGAEILGAVSIAIMIIGKIISASEKKTGVLEDVGCVLPSKSDRK